VRRAILSLIAVVLAGPVWADPGGPPRRVLAADYSPNRRQVALLDAQGVVVWRHPIRNIHDLHMLDNGHVLFQTDWTHLVEVNGSGEVVWEYDAATANGNAGRPVEVHAFQRLADGTTMIAESGPGRIIEVDRAGRLVREIRLTLDKRDVHRDTRNARKLDNGHYLVAHEGDGKVREYDAAGNIVWEHTVGSAVYSAVRLPGGNTLIGTGNGHSVLEVSADHQVVWSVTANELAGITLAWVTQVARRGNGNTIIVNRHAGPDNPQILEVTPDKKVVWTFKNFEAFGNSLPVAQVLDLEGPTAR
jgi:hypothetical protein